MSRDELKMDRRSALTLLGAAAWTAGTSAGAEAPLRFTGLDHVEFWASDVEKTRDFYARIFGNTVMKNNKTTRRYIQLGNAYIAIDKGQDAGRVDHFCVGIPDFQIAAVHSFLQQNGIDFKDYPSGRDLAVTDPDGTRMQLAADNGWNALVTGGTGSPENVPLQSEPIFSPTSLDYVLLNVADQEKAAGFYAKIFGPVTLRLDGQVWFNAGFSRIILRHTPSDQRVGVGRIGVSAAPFDPREMVKKLQYVGARVETPEVAGGLEFHDPDGLLVHVLHPIRD